MLNNRITSLLGIRYPIIEGGMAYIGDGNLAAAVSEAGGFGQVAVSGRRPEDFNYQIEIAASLTDQPIGVNIPISGFFTQNDYFDVIEKHKDRIHAVSLASGDPRPFIPYFKDMGLKVMVVVGTVKHALNAERAGADLIICEGFEAGGRNSPYELTLFSLIPQVVNAVQLPVAAAGGIVDGKGIMAAMALGAEGVQMGTRFIATKECEAHQKYKDFLVESNDHATVVIERSVGRVNRVLKNSYVNTVMDVEKENLTPGELYPYISGAKNKIAALQGKIEEGWVHAGQTVGLIDSVETVDEIMKRLVSEIEEERSKLFSVQR